MASRTLGTATIHQLTRPLRSATINSKCPKLHRWSRTFSSRPARQSHIHHPWKQHSAVLFAAAATVALIYSTNPFTQVSAEAPLRNLPRSGSKNQRRKRVFPKKRIEISSAHSTYKSRRVGKTPVFTYGAQIPPKWLHQTPTIHM